MKSASRLFIVLFLLALLPLQFRPAAAQGAGTLILSTPDVQRFPEILLQFEAYDSQGEFLAGLTAQDVQVAEDGQVLPADAVDQVNNGLQTIIALNTAAILANQVNGISQYQHIQTALQTWATSLTATGPDDFSLATPTGLFLIRTKDPRQLVKALTEYQPDLAKAQPSLGSLAEALDLATEPLDSPGMKRAILYVTPPLSPANNANLTDLASRAQKTGTRINVWLVSATPAANATENTPNPLKDLAETTGGVFVQVNPAEPLPEIEPLFTSLRYVYQVRYTSTIQTDGPHRLSVQVKTGEKELVSPVRSFDLTVHPPNPIFLSPPASIQRAWEVSTVSGKPRLAPDAVPLKIVIEFPDQHPRALKTTRLYVDGARVDENTAEPFDQFTWPVTDLETPARHTLQVEAVDILDLSGKSMEIPVDVLVEKPARAGLFSHISSQGLIAVGAVATAGMILALILSYTGRRRWPGRKRTPAEKKAARDPITQPVPIKQETTRPKREHEPFFKAGSVWPLAGQSAPARLVTLDENEQPITGGTILLTRQEITFGADPHRATQVLDAPSVDGLHARLFRTAEGGFCLADQGSIAGTWINYAPVSSSGASLEHGDLIHIGKVSFRFELTDPSRAPQPVIKVTELEK